MSVFPHSQLFLGSSSTVVISGPHIQVIHTATGDVLHSTADLDDPSKDALLKSGPIRCAALDKSKTHLATAGDDKQLKIWEIDGLKLLSERELPKRPTDVQFTADAQTVLVSDKFGDVFSYPFHPIEMTTKQKRDALSSHENPSGGQLILGHASLLLAFLLTNDEKYIVTADRDEHIRVSWYPQGYTIEMYCLGHEKYVSSIHIPSFSTSTLISGGGDPVLKLWDWMTGVEKHEINIADAVDPFIKIRSSKRKRGEGDDDDDELPNRRKGKGKKAKAKKGKGKGDGAAQEDVKNNDGSADQGQPSTVLVDDDGSDPAEKGETILVVHKIETLESPSGRYIVFSAVGATALFTTPYPEEGAPAPSVRAFDFGKPVIDFIVAEDGLLWVTLDAQWVDPQTPLAQESRAVRVVALSSGQLTESTLDTPLLAALNSRALIPATPSELKSLDLYADLAALPKAVELPELEAIGGADALAEAPDVGGKEGVSKKVLGRLKSKQAVQAKLQAGGAGAGEGEDGEEAPESKRARSEVGEDTAMAEGGGGA